VGDPSYEIASRPQNQEPGCFWNLEECPDDLSDLDDRGSAPAVECGGPFINTVPVYLIRNYEERLWVIGVDVDPVDDRIRPLSFTSSPFSVVFPRTG
jgi:hypothetical protein